VKKWAIGLILVFIVFLYVLLGQRHKEVITSEEFYQSAMELYDRGRYGEAIDRFLQFLRLFPESQRVSQTQYMIGQGYLKMGGYEKAVEQFEIYIKEYPHAKQIEEAKREVQLAKEKLKDKKEEKGTQESEAIPEKTERGEAKKEQKSLKDMEVMPSPAVKKGKRRIAVQAFDFDVRSLDQVEKRMKGLKEAGVDTLIFRVFQEKGEPVYKFATPRSEEGVYFKTEYAPVVDDILGRIAEMAHRNRLDLFAWMTTRYAAFGSAKNPEQLCKRFNHQTKKVELTKGYTLFHPEVLKRLEGIYRDLSRYPIDGILFQEDLALRPDEDFSTEANKAFQKEFGNLPQPESFYLDLQKPETGLYQVKTYGDRFWTWANWKNRWLMDVAQRLMNAARESNPNLQFGLNLYYETILDPSDGLAFYSQSLSGAIEKNFDYYAVMAYHRQMMRDLKIEKKKALDLVTQVAAKAVKSAGDASKVMMKVQIHDWKSYEMIPPKEVEEILSEILSHGETSFAFVPYTERFPFQELKQKWGKTSQ
jgi:hypothetical protein